MTPSPLLWSPTLSGCLMGSTRSRCVNRRRLVCGNLTLLYPLPQGAVPPHVQPVLDDLLSSSARIVTSRPVHDALIACMFAHMIKFPFIFSGVASKKRKFAAGELMLRDVNRVRSLDFPVILAG